MALESFFLRFSISPFRWMSTSCSKVVPSIVIEPKAVWSMVGFILLLLNWLLFRRCVEADRQTIPGVDGYYGQRQVDQFFAGKLFAHRCIYGVWHVVNRNESHGLCPCQSCPFTLSIERGLAPGKKFVDALFGFTARPRGFGMRVYSIGTPVDL